MAAHENEDTSSFNFDINNTIITISPGDFIHDNQFVCTGSTVNTNNHINIYFI